MHFLPGWAWLLFMGLLLVIGIVSQDPQAFLVVGVSIGLTLVIGLILRVFRR